MFTKLASTLCVCAALAALALSGNAWAAQGGGNNQGQNGQNGQNGQQRGERIEQMLDRWLGHVTENIQRLQDRMNKHPDAPDAIKTAAQKLLADLNTLKTDLTNAKNANASDKNGRQTLRAQLEKDHEAVRADREALRSAVQSAMQQHQGQHHGMGGHGQGHGQGQGQNNGQTSAQML